LIQDRHVLAVPVGAPPGSYSIQVALSSKPAGSATIVSPDALRGAAFTSSPVVAVARPAGPVSPPIMTQTTDARWNELALAGYRLGVDSVAAGDSLPLDLYWQALQPPALDYAAWVELVDAEGVAHASLLARPAGDSFPTTNWKAGDIWLDKLQLKLDASTAPGDATVLLTLVDEQTHTPIAPRTTLPIRQISAEVAPLSPAPFSAVELLHVKIDPPVN
jgi:hypothetical protein